MSSINTNLSSLTALQSLRSTQQMLSKAQNEVATGLKVQSAADNASTWSIATTMKSDNSVLSTISDALGVGNQALTVASSAVNQAITVVNAIKQAVAQATDPNADQSKILTSLQAFGQQLKNIVSSANMNGVNLLNGSQTSFDLIASYTDGKGAAFSTIGTINLTLTALITPFTAPATTGTGVLQTAQATGVGAPTDFTALTLADLNTAAGSGTVAAGPPPVNTSKIQDTLSNADQAIKALTTYATNIGATQSSVTAQSDFLKSLQSSLTAGVSSLVDADMNEVSTRLQALQTQQQLGVQALSIANQNSQMILKLFQ
ncbi:flagellin [Methylocystis sp. MJC1]|jgi:flagellin|uniref:flagellin N-terminal helical domain-containing protein n=1 Tax=Methylocystis sp. MJC1 TaxID=2654282 RepID=UPI0013ED555A|nr:flagellin [Methylocystis sp. MJC1]KAF2990653.1 Flagellin [Methylocystis sp. MJC1]MBU6525684.1 flagellin [Methylocystis sp. MJC1]UZX12156.1 flagellin [Methylocystis sp. MJC1]